MSMTLETIRAAHARIAPYIVRTPLLRLPALDDALGGLETLPSDLLGEEIRQAIFHLGTITGEITTDEVLGQIFSKFCIGK